MIGNRSHNFSGDSIDLLLHGRLCPVDNISCIFWTMTNISKLHRNEEVMEQRLLTDTGKMWRVMYMNDNISLL